MVRSVNHSDLDRPNPYYISYGNESVLPIGLEVPTWRILPWDDVNITSDLLAMRARELQRRDEDLEEAVLHLQCMRFEGKERARQKARHSQRKASNRKRSITTRYQTREGYVAEAGFQMARPISNLQRRK